MAATRPGLSRYRWTAPTSLCIALSTATTAKLASQSIELKLKFIKMSERERATNNSSAGQMKYKIVFLGDQSVGKTSIILRFTQDSFDVKY